MSFLAPKKSLKKGTTWCILLLNVINNNDNTMIIFGKFQQEIFAIGMRRMMYGANFPRVQKCIL
jgi:hypothetical protein